MISNVYHLVYSWSGCTGHVIHDYAYSSLQFDITLVMCIWDCFSPTNTRRLIFIFFVNSLIFQNLFLWIRYWRIPYTWTWVSHILISVQSVTVCAVLFCKPHHEDNLFLVALFFNTVCQVCIFVQLGQLGRNGCGNGTHCQSEKLSLSTQLLRPLSVWDTMSLLTQLLLSSCMHLHG